MRSAGGVLGRDSPSGRQILLVHRPRYDDWSLPKGKLDADEHPLAAAVREVQEETGVRGVPLLRLPSTRYLTGAPGVEKSVEYWAMRPTTVDGFVPNDEVDEVRWVLLAEAAALLTYAHDRGVVHAYARYRPVSGLVLLLRHAQAGRPDQWSGPDRERPLDAAGQATAQALSPLLGLFQPTLVIAATAVRCNQTVEPLASAISAPARSDAAFDESTDPAVAAEAVRVLAESGATAVVCSQGALIPAVLRLLTGRRTAPYDTPKGTSWVLAFTGAQLAAADRLDPPGANQPPQWT